MTISEEEPVKIASVLRQLAERASTQPFDFDGHFWQRHQATDFARWLVNRATEFEHGTLVVPDELTVPARFTEQKVEPVEKHGCKRGPVEFPSAAGFPVPREVVDQGYEPPGVPLPESLGGTDQEPDPFPEITSEIDDHLRDIRQWLLNVAAELDQIGESTQALLSSRLYWVEFAETADGPDFATELADVGTKIRHLQRILAAAERASSS